MKVEDEDMEAMWVLSGRSSPHRLDVLQSVNVEQAEGLQGQEGL